MSSWRTIRVPASSANLGPGFDALGLALGIYLECRFRPSNEGMIRVSGVDSHLISTGPENLIYATAKPARPIELEICNEIPLGKGLGSSAAAVVAGVLIASEVADCKWDRQRVLDESARIEGHPDNVAPCVLGGLVSAAFDCAGTVRAVRHSLHPDYSVGVVVPDFVLPTQQSRLVLPKSVPWHDAIFNIQRVALLVSALTTGATGVFPAALEDRLHQPYRTPLVPGLEEILNLKAPGLLGCALSGAGPSVLVFYERGHEDVCTLVQKVFIAHGHSSEILSPGVPDSGYMVE